MKLLKLTIMKKIIFTIALFSICTISAKAFIMPIGAGPIHKEVIPYVSDNSFPKVKGMNLEGEEKILPQDLKAPTNIVIVAFKREQQADVDTWIKALNPILESNTNLALYEIPTLKKFNFLMRYNINNGMRYGIPDKKARERTICVYLDKPSFRKKLAIENEDQIVVFVIDQKGIIKTKILGIATPKSLNIIKTFLK
jgi:hypothetical protein